LFSTGSALGSVIPPATASDACGNEFASTDVAANGAESMMADGNGVGKVGSGSIDSAPLMPFLMAVTMLVASSPIGPGRAVNGELALYSRSPSSP